VDMLEAMTTCEGEMTAREEKRTNRKAEGWTTACCLGLSSIGRARVEKYANEGRNGADVACVWRDQAGGYL
jgi:hypothetical protein